jgi:hypothetical protein
MSFSAVPKQVKKQNVYDKLNLHQLQIASNLDREARVVLTPIIRHKRRQLFIQNYTLLFNHINDRVPDRTLLQSIYNTYGKESLFYDFLFRYLEIQAPTKGRYETLIRQLQRLSQGTNLLDRFLQNARVRNLYTRLPY